MLGYALVFAAVVASVSLIFTLGVGTLRDLQHGEQMENTERAFDVLATNLADVHREGAPSRATELKTAGGQYGPGEDLTMVVNVTDPGTGTTTSTVVAATPVSYSNRETEIVYTTGGVVRADRGAGLFVRDPPFRFSEERVVIPFVSTYVRTNTTTIGGEGTVLVVGFDRGSSLLATADRTPSQQVTVEMTVTSPRYRAWDRYLEREGLTRQSIDAGSETVTYEYTTDTAFLRRTTVAVDLER